MSGTCVLLVDGDYLLRGLNPSAATDKAFSIAHALDQELMRPLGAALSSTTPAQQVGGEEQISLRMCFFTEQLLHRTAAACGGSTTSAEEKVCAQYIAGIKASRFQVVLVPESNAPERRGTSAVDAALATKAALLSVRNAKYSKFIFFCNAGSYSTVMQHLANEGKDVFVCSFVDDEMPDLVDWTAFLSSTSGTPDGVVRIRKMTEAPTTVPNPGRSLAQISATFTEKHPVVSPPPLANGTNPFDDAFNFNDVSTGGKSAAADAPSSPSSNPKPAEAAPQKPPESAAVSSSDALTPSTTSSPARPLTTPEAPNMAAPPVVPADVAQPQQPAVVAVPVNQPPLAAPQQQQQQDTPASARPASADPQQQPQPDVITALPPACSIHFDAHYRRHYYMVPDGRGGSKSQWEHPLGPTEQLNVERQVNDWYEAQKAKKYNTTINTTTGSAGSSVATTPVASYNPAMMQHGGDAHSVVPQARQAPQGPVAQETRSSMAVRPPTLPQPLSGGGVSQTAPEQPLPAGWEAVYDAPSMRMAFVHRASGTRSFERPSSTQPMNLSAGAQQQQQQQLQPSANTGGTADEKNAWVMRVEPVSGRTYFVNPITRQSVWTLPPGASASLATTGGGQPSPAVAQQQQPGSTGGYPQQPGNAGGYPQQQQQQGPYPPQQQQQQLQGGPVNPAGGGAATGVQPRLPTGWEARVDPQTGKTFYVDHILKRTTWSLPPNVA